MSAVRYEWVRLGSIRSTKLITLFVLLLGVGAGVLARDADFSSDEGLRSLLGPSLLVLSVIVSVIPAQAIGQEYRFGLIRQTLTLLPNRRTVTLAKWSVSVTAATALTLAALGVAIGTAVALGATAPTASGLAAGLGKVAAYMAAYLTVVFAVASLTRQVALGVVLPLLFNIIVESLLTELGGVDSRLLPFGSGREFLSIGGLWTDWVVFAGYALVLLVLAGAAFSRRDA